MFLAVGESCDAMCVCMTFRRTDVFSMHLDLAICNHELSRMNENVNCSTKVALNG